MADVALCMQENFITDLLVENNDLVRDDGLRTAMLVSMFTDRRAHENERLPDGETDPRGWWADTFPDVPGDETGSRLWLLHREKQTAETAARARLYAMEALQWLIEDGVATNLDVSASWTAPGVLTIEVIVYRPGDVREVFTFDDVWKAEQARI